ncbi:MAG: Chemotaxis protein methyltransferase [Phycisphaerae bacterium]|nr:Chemotaxis protein methyltransferase [Phycisphaerae bacterium]
MNNINPVTDSVELSNQDYNLIAQLVYQKSGINLGDNKQQLVRSRLGKLLRKGNFKSFREYYRHVEQDPSGEELCRLLDAISTNTTHLFREIGHFNFLRATVQKWLADSQWRKKYNTLRIWSAGCSSGEEPHSIAMTMADILSGEPGMTFKILATDLSTHVLAKAKLGLYDIHRVGTVPEPLRKKYLQQVEQEGQRFLQLIPELRQSITFTRFNLMDAQFPFKHGFDVIFCRNVMIYFDRPTQEKLVNKYAQQLHPGGYLFIGHSESLNGLTQPLKYIQPTIYQKA